MKTKNKNLLLALMLLMSTACIIGCKKAAPASLIGTWRLMSGRHVVKTGSITQSDTTIYYTTDTVTYTFASDMLWSRSSTPGQTTVLGKYAVQGNNLMLSDTVWQGTNQFVIEQYAYLVLSVTDHALVFQESDTLTTSLPLAIYQDTYTFSR